MPPRRERMLRNPALPIADLDPIHQPPINREPGHVAEQDRNLTRAQILASVKALPYLIRRLGMSRHRPRLGLFAEIVTSVDRRCRKRAQHEY